MKKQERENMNKRTDWLLLARYLSDECSQEEEGKIEAWIASDPENQRLTELMKVAWNTPELKPQTSDVEMLWRNVAEKAGIESKTEDHKIPEKPETTSRTNRWPLNFQPRSYRILRYAAVLLVATSLAYFFMGDITYLPWGQQVAESETITVEKGDRQNVVLSDGTTIVLDAGSSLKYPESFENTTRKVFLDGEGYFEVASNPEKPFIVQANHAVIKVLGTKFNVRAWQPNQRVTVAVAEGKVLLRQKEGDTETAVVIARGQSSTLPKIGQPSVPHTVDVGKYLGWMHNEVVFDNTPLSEILFQFERWYDLQFVLNDSSIAGEHLTMHIKDESISDILELIEALTDLHSVYEGKTVYLEPQKTN